jgi:hypothetical protein
MSAWDQTLRHEFQAEEGSFLIQLRPNLVWDRSAFSTMTDAMLACAAHYEKSDSRPQWIAEGFWFLGTFVREWSSHPNFPKSFEASYYAAAYQRLDDLAYWFFRGESPYTAEHEWKPL